MFKPLGLKGLRHQFRLEQEGEWHCRRRLQPVKRRRKEEEEEKEQEKEKKSQTRQEIPTSCQQVKREEEGIKPVVSGVDIFATRGALDQVESVGEAGLGRAILLTLVNDSSVNNDKGSGLALGTYKVLLLIGATLSNEFNTVARSAPNHAAITVEAVCKSQQQHNK